MKRKSTLKSCKCKYQKSSRKPSWEKDQKERDRRDEMHREKLMHDLHIASKLHDKSARRKNRTKCY